MFDPEDKPTYASLKKAEGGGCGGFLIWRGNYEPNKVWFH